VDEEKLIKRAARGDAQAFNELMAGQERRMYAVALRMFGTKEDAEDSMQEAMLRIYRSLSSFKAQSSFSTWVYRVTMNTCLDELRRRKNKPNTSLDGLLDAGWSPADSRDTPEQHAVRADVAVRALALAQRGLAAEHRDVGVVDRIAAPGLLALDLGVGRADQAVGALVQRALGVQLVADAAPCALSEHRGAFITQGVRMLESAELTPALVEFTCHA
jgi:RNA polymerase sigma-70 factor (ECF subfamily)